MARDGKGTNSKDHLSKGVITVRGQAQGCVEKGQKVVGGTLRHAAPATNADHGHMFIGPAGISADKSNENSSLAS